MFFHETAHLSASELRHQKDKQRARSVLNDIERIDRVLMQSNSQKTKALHIELDGVYQTQIANWGMSMYSYMKPYGFVYDNLSDEAIIDNLHIMKGQLRGYMLQLDPNIEFQQQETTTKESEITHMTSMNKKRLSDYVQIAQYKMSDIALNIPNEKYPLLKDTLDYLVQYGYIIPLNVDSGNSRLYKIEQAFHAFPQHLEHQAYEERTMQSNYDSKKVFIVHGHDHDLLNEVELMIHRIGLKPVILKDQANSGDTIIEKIEHHTDVGFGIVLYTACDEGSARDSGVVHFRARQNVVFEHGYLCAKLGRNRVAAINDDNIEVPSDLSGVLYIPRSAPDWKNQLLREIKAAGLEFDSTKA